MVRGAKFLGDNLLLLSHCYFTDCVGVTLRTFALYDTVYLRNALTCATSRIRAFHSYNLKIQRYLEVGMHG